MSICPIRRFRHARLVALALSAAASGVAIGATPTPPPASRAALALTRYWAQHAASFDPASGSLVMPDGSREKLRMAVPQSVMRPSGPRDTSLSANQPGFVSGHAAPPDAPPPRASVPTISVEPATVMARPGSTINLAVSLADGAGITGVRYALLAPGQSPDQPGAPGGLLQWLPGQAERQILRVTLPSVPAGKRWREVDFVLYDPRGAALARSASTRMLVVAPPSQSRPGFGAGAARTAHPTSWVPARAGAGSP